MEAGPSTSRPSRSIASTSRSPERPRLSTSRAPAEPEDDEARLSVLLAPPPIPGVENWGIPPRPTAPPDPALVAKLAKFHELKRRGTHFNDTLMSNKSFRNPHIYERLVQWVEVNERGTNFPKDVWDPWDFRPEWKAAALAEEQRKRSEALEAAQARGKRSEIAFTSAKSGDERPAHRERERDRDRDRTRDRDRERGKDRYEPYPPPRGKEREREEKRSRWDVRPPPRDKRENGRR